MVEGGGGGGGACRDPLPFVPKPLTILRAVVAVDRGSLLRDVFGPKLLSKALMLASVCSAPENRLLELGTGWTPKSS